MKTKMSEERNNNCCFTCANHRKTCFHGATNLRNFTEKECKHVGPPYYRKEDES